MPRMHGLGCAKAVDWLLAALGGVLLQVGGGSATIPVLYQTFIRESIDSRQRVRIPVRNGGDLGLVFCCLALGKRF